MKFPFNPQTPQLHQRLRSSENGGVGSERGPGCPVVQTHRAKFDPGASSERLRPLCSGVEGGAVRSVFGPKKVGGALKKSGLWNFLAQTQIFPGGERTLSDCAPVKTGALVQSGVEDALRSKRTGRKLTPGRSIPGGLEGYKRGRRFQLENTHAPTGRWIENSGSLTSILQKKHIS